MNETAAIRRLDDCGRRVVASLSATPIEPLALEVQEFVGASIAAIKADPSRASQAAHIVRYCDKLISLLPDNFGERFDFNHWLLHTLLRRLQSEGMTLSTSAIPSVADAWSYVRWEVPKSDGRRRVVGIYRFPGTDEDDDVDLRDYPWLFHEIAHAVLGKGLGSFAGDFDKTLSALITAMRRPLFSLRDEARRRHEAMIQRVSIFWNPESSPTTWAAEIAMDIIALMIGGDAYAAVLRRVTRSRPEDVHRLEQGHPPIAARLQALSIAADQLGMPEVREALDQDLALAPVAPPDYGFVVRPEILDAVVKSSLLAARSYGLKGPLLVASTAVTAFDTNAVPADGLMAILMAARASVCLDTASYRHWQRTLIDAVMTP